MHCVYDVGNNARKRWFACYISIQLMFKLKSHASHIHPISLGETQLIEEKGYETRQSSSLLGAHCAQNLAKQNALKGFVAHRQLTNRNIAIT